MNEKIGINALKNIKKSNNSLERVFQITRDFITLRNFFLFQFSSFIKSILSKKISIKVWKKESELFSNCLTESNLKPIKTGLQVFWITQ
jgi:hypothetical protein